ncbi:MAG TPA: hypothetical protein PKI10_16025 [Syntrophorhabdus sp.]|nr:hypothetical protein [Syntrophorhabdus sp.]HQM44124.1 hypothetical protein [Smithellaceae bacterium]
MNDKQKKVLIASAVTVLVMLLYPPFHVVWEGGKVLSMGYGWIFDPPIYSTVNTGLLLTQWVAVLIVGAIAYFLFKDKP